jgi:hypothetical protein
MAWSVEGGQRIVDLRVIDLSGVWAEVHRSYLQSKRLPEERTESLSHKGVSGRLAVAELGVGLVRLEPVDHHLDHRQLDERLRRQHRLLPIQVQPPAPAQPGERPLNGLIANDKFCLTRLFRMAP